ARCSRSRNCGSCASIAPTCGKSCCTWTPTPGSPFAPTTPRNSWKLVSPWKKNAPPKACPTRGGPFMLPCVTGWQRRKPPILEPPESIPLVDLAAAAAACLVGIGRAGYAVGCRRGAGWDLVRCQRPAGAAAAHPVDEPDPAL